MTDGTIERIEAENGDKFLVIEVVAAKADATLAERVIETATEYDESWEDNEETDIDEYDEIVERSVAALGLTSAIEHYQKAYDDDRVDGLDLRRGDLEPGSPLDVCRLFVVSQYREGRDIEYELLSDATVALARLNSARKPTDPSPST